MDFFKYLILLIFLLISPLSHLTAQYDHFNLLSLQSEGEMPNDFIQIAQQVDDVKLHTLCKSGLAIYGTKYNQYLQNIIDRLIENNQLWKGKIKIYLYRSPENNIFSTNDGTIFINIGLLANLTNETELAFVLAHEIAHIVQNHPHDYTHFPRKKRSVYTDFKNKDHNRSLEDDLQADQYGYEHFFLVAGFNSSEIVNVFNHLDSHFQKTINSQTLKLKLSNEHISWSDSYFNDLNTEENSNDDQLEESLQSRKKELEKWIKNDATNAKTQNSQFPDLIQWSHNELLGLYLLEHDYNHSFYFNLLLFELYPEDPNIEIAWLASNFGFFRLKSTCEKCELNEDDPKSESQKIIHKFLNKISLEEQKQFTFSIAKNLHTKYPENDYVTKVYNCLNGNTANTEPLIPPIKLVTLQPKFYKINKNRDIIGDHSDNLWDEISSISACFNGFNSQDHIINSDILSTPNYNVYCQLQLVKYEITTQLDSQLIYIQLLNFPLSSMIGEFKYINFLNVNYRSVPDRFITRFYLLPLIALTPPSIPFTMAHVFANRKRIEAQFVICNIQTGNLVYLNTLNISDFNGKSILKQFLFDNYKKVLQP